MFEHENLSKIDTYTEMDIYIYRERGGGGTDQEMDVAVPLDQHSNLSALENPIYNKEKYKSNLLIYSLKQSN